MFSCADDDVPVPAELLTGVICTPVVAPVVVVPVVTVVVGVGVGVRQPPHPPAPLFDLALVVIVYVPD